MTDTKLQRLILGSDAVLMRHDPFGIREVQQRMSWLLFQGIGHEKNLRHPGATRCVLVNSQLHAWDLDSKGCTSSFGEMRAS